MYNSKIFSEANFTFGVVQINKLTTVNIFCKYKKGSMRIYRIIQNLALNVIGNDP